MCMHAHVELILKKTTGLCPSRSYYSMPLLLRRRLPGYQWRWDIWICNYFCTMKTICPETLQGWASNPSLVAHNFLIMIVVCWDLIHKADIGLIDTCKCFSDGMKAWWRSSDCDWVIGEMWECFSECGNVRVSEWVSEWVNKWVSEWVSEWVHEWVSEWVRAINTGREIERCGLGWKLMGDWKVQKKWKSFEIVKDKTGKMK